MHMHVHTYVHTVRMYMHDCATIIGSYRFITSCNLTKSISVSSFAKKKYTGGFLAYFIDRLTMLLFDE